MTVSCSGECKAGYYGKEGVVNATCPACCSGKCAPGRYGIGISTTVSCSGPCDSGSYCSPGSTIPDAAECGDPEVYCPKGTEDKKKADPGFYTICGDATTSSCNRTRVAQKKAPPGHYAMHGILHKCPVGTYGFGEGLNSDVCSGECKAGYSLHCSTYSIPRKSPNFPRGHLPEPLIAPVQSAAVAPPPILYVPAKHFPAQTLVGRPGTSPNLPTAHSTHCVTATIPLTLEYLPIGQFPEQALDSEPPLPHFPLGHLPVHSGFLRPNVSP